MPGKNVVKRYIDDTYYHIYSRGINKNVTFHDDEDYTVFLGLLRRYLSRGKLKNGARMPYPHFHEGVDLLSYCLMPNHFHLLVYQRHAPVIAQLMKSALTSYGMYFNKKYDRQGPVFQSRYRASIIDQDNYLHHISRYIHLNPNNWRTYKYSSLAYYLGEKSADWVHPGQILELFGADSQKYLSFIEDYEDQKDVIDELKWELANDDDS